MCVQLAIRELKLEERGGLAGLRVRAVTKLKICYPPVSSAPSERETYV